MNAKETLVQRIAREIKDFFSLYKSDRKLFFPVALVLLAIGSYFVIVDILPTLRERKDKKGLYESSLTKVEQDKTAETTRTQLLEPKQQSSEDIISMRKDEKKAELPLFQAVKRATVAMVVFHEGNLERPFTILGTGFCVHPKGIIVTCRHVVAAFMKKPIEQQVEELPKAGKKGLQPIGPVNLVIPHAVFFNTEISKEHLFARVVRAGYVIAEMDYDVALVKLHPHAAYPKGFPHVEIEDFVNVYEGMEIATCGFPLGNYLKEQMGTVTSSFTRGSLSAIIPAPNITLDLLKGFQLDLTATFGSSGGPVFSVDSGKVLGVLQGGLKSFPGITKAEPIYPILAKGTIDRILSAPLQ